MRTLVTQYEIIHSIFLHFLFLLTKTIIPWNLHGTLVDLVAKNCLNISKIYFLNFFLNNARPPNPAPNNNMVAGSGTGAATSRSCL